MASGASRRPPRPARSADGTRAARARPPAPRLARAAATPWGRGTGEGIGLSGHKNEYISGVRIGNWVEEQFGREATGAGDSLKQFMRAQETAATAMGGAEAPARSMRVEPNLGVPADMLFSHGRTFSTKFEAAMTALHYTDPSKRSYGAASNDRVHKSFFYGSKHIDAFVPLCDPNVRLQLTASKQAQWAGQQSPQLPTGPDMYQTTYKGSY